jgi:hypothetical protein
MWCTCCAKFICHIHTHTQYKHTHTHTHTPSLQKCYPHRTDLFKAENVAMLCVKIVESLAMVKVSCVCLCVCVCVCVCVYVCIYVCVCVYV